MAKAGVILVMSTFKKGLLVELAQTMLTVSHRFVLHMATNSGHIVFLKQVTIN